MTQPNADAGRVKEGAKRGETTVSENKPTERNLNFMMIVTS